MGSGGPRQVEGSSDEDEVFCELVDVAFEFAFLLGVSSILQFLFGLADALVENFVGSKEGIDVIAKGDSAVNIFGCVLEDLHGDLAIELGLLCVDLEEFVEGLVYAVLIEPVCFLVTKFLVKLV